MATLDSRAATDVLVGGSGVLATLIASPLVRARYNRWGATWAETAAPMPGDDLVPDPDLGYTRAVTIEAPVDRVWPWLAQIGQGRGGLYSYDRLENLVGCRIRSAETILPDHQRLAAGDLIRLGPQGYPCFIVHSVAPAKSLVLLGADPKPPHAAPATNDPAGAATWQWVLRPASKGTATRLIVRQRLAFPPRARAMWRIVEPIGFVMERRMLLGIKRRAERAG